MNLSEQSNPPAPNQQGPQVFGPQNSPSFGGGISQGPNSPKPPITEGNKSKKLIIIIGALLAVFALAAIVAVILPGGGTKKSEQQQNTTNASEYVKEPTAIDVETTNNSITDDISKLNETDDFNSQKLSDEELDL